MSSSQHAWRVTADSVLITEMGQYKKPLPKPLPAQRSTQLKDVLPGPGSLGLWDHFCLISMMPEGCLESSTLHPYLYPLPFRPWQV